jgi:hypothetical protein
VGWIVGDATNPSAPPTVQTSPSTSGGTAVAAITATPVIQRQEAAPSPPEPARSGRSDAELDELATALFGRIRGQLRAEVIHEREAKGLAFDAF